MTHALAKIWFVNMAFLATFCRRSVALKPPQVCKARYPNNAPKEIVAAVHGPRCGCHVGTLPEALGGQEGGKVLDFQMLPGCFFENPEISEMNSARC